MFHPSVIPDEYERHACMGAIIIDLIGKMKDEGTIFLKNGIWCIKEIVFDVSTETWKVISEDIGDIKPLVILTLPCNLTGLQQEGKIFMKKNGGGWFTTGDKIPVSCALVRNHV